MTAKERRAAWWHFQLLDHAFLRRFWWNLHEIAPGVWRSNQPSPARLARYKALGIRSVLSLRGQKDISYVMFEKEACADLGLCYEGSGFFGTKALPSAQTIANLTQAFARQERPFLMHCKSGSDRTGMAAALYLALSEGQPVEQAKQQLHWRHVHLRWTKTGVLDHLFTVYLRDVAPTGRSFADWIADGYDPGAVTQDFYARREGGFLKRFKR